MDFKKKSKEKVELTEKQKTLKALVKLLLRILIIIGIAVATYIWVGEVAVNHDNNMFPSVKDGDLAITYKLDGYYQNDIVIYELDGIKHFGRVVGVPGDIVDIAEIGGYTVNGSVLYETIIYPTNRADNSKIEYPYIVGENEYFILNDYRENTGDSRIYGGISNLHGKVVLLLRRRGF